MEEPRGHGKHVWVYVSPSAAGVGAQLPHDEALCVGVVLHHGWVRCNDVHELYSTPSYVNGNAHGAPLTVPPAS